MFAVLRPKRNNGLDVIDLPLEQLIPYAGNPRKNETRSRRWRPR